MNKLIFAGLTVSGGAMAVGLVTRNMKLREAATLPLIGFLTAGLITGK